MNPYTSQTSLSGSNAITIQEQGYTLIVKDHPGKNLKLANARENIFQGLEMQLMMQCLSKMHQAQGSIAVTGRGGGEEEEEEEEGRRRKRKKGEGRGGDRMGRQGRGEGERWILCINFLLCYNEAIIYVLMT